jgi:hypothetical protein
MGTVTDFTIACWYKTLIFTEKVLFTYGGYPQNSYGIWMHGGVAMAIMITSTPAVFGTATGIVQGTSDGNWHLAIATFQRAGNITLHVDNDTILDSPTIVDISGQTAFDLSNSIGLMVGADESPATNFLDGSVDEIGIWNRVLTGGEMTALWNAGAGVTYPFS